MNDNTVNNDQSCKIIFNFYNMGCPSPNTTTTPLKPKMQNEELGTLNENSLKKVRLLSNGLNSAEKPNLNMLKLGYQIKKKQLG